MFKRMDQRSIVQYANNQVQKTKSIAPPLPCVNMSGQYNAGITWYGHQYAESMGAVLGYISYAGSLPDTLIVSHKDWAWVQKLMQTADLLRTMTVKNKHLKHTVQQMQCVFKKSKKCLSIIMMS